MKCTSCGSEELIDIGFIPGHLGEDGSPNHPSVYACKKCGHIELFLSQESIERIELKRLQKSTVRFAQK